jgi:hypothetical protein
MDEKTHENDCEVERIWKSIDDMDDPAAQLSRVMSELLKGKITPKEAKAMQRRIKREEKIGQENLRSIILMNSAATLQFNAVKYQGPIDAEVIEACRRAARSWNELANNLERRSER